jgi:hypothetical protein
MNLLRQKQQLRQRIPPWKRHCSIPPFCETLMITPLPSMRQQHQSM